MEVCSTFIFCETINTSLGLLTFSKCQKIAHILIFLFIVLCHPSISLIFLLVNLDRDSLKCKTTLEMEDQQFFLRPILMMDSCKLY